MTEERLKEIELRREHWREWKRLGDSYVTAFTLVESDMPELIGEVRRLKKLLKPTSLSRALTYPSKPSQLP